MNNDWQSIANSIIKRYWGLDLEIPIHISARLTKTLGTYEFRKSNDEIIPICIKLSKDLVIYGEEKFIIFILKHELCHFVLSQSNIPFYDGDSEFELELARIGALPTKCVKILYRTHCKNCQMIISFTTKKHAFDYIEEKKCSCCKKRLSFLDIHYLKKEKAPGLCQ